MLRKIYLTIIATIALGVAGFAQQNKGAIKVTLTDEKTKEPLAFANVIVTLEGQQVATGTTDFDGVVVIKPLDPGKYNVKAVYVGYQKKEVTGVRVLQEKTAYVNIPMANDGGVVLDEVQIVSYTEPLIDPDTKSGGTVTREEYQHMATKNIMSVASTTAGVYQADEGSAINVRGARSGNTNVFIDGERAIGTTQISQQAVEQVSVILGGLPAQFGDVTSGVINITTRGPQPKFFGGVEAISSQLTDKYGYNFIGFSVGGPIWSQKDSTGAKKTRIGFFLGGEAVREKDPNPSAVGQYKVKDDVLNSIKEKPLVRQENGGYIPAAFYANMNDFEKVKARQNVAQTSFRLNPKVDFKITDNLNITLGGSWEYLKYHSFINSYSLFNAASNPLTTQNTYRGYVRLQQKFGKSNAREEEKSQSIVKNAYLNLQVGFQRYQAVTQDESHKNNFFKYGYIGQFNSSQFTQLLSADSVAWQKDTLTASGEDTLITKYVHPGSGGSVYYNFAPFDSVTTFVPGTDNPTAANYASQIFNENTVHGYNDPINNYSTWNGQMPVNVQSLWGAPGAKYSSYAKNDYSIFRLTSSFSADIRNHSIMLGVEFDQRAYSGYSVYATGLWNLGRQYLNRQLATLSSVDPTITTDTTTGNAFVTYNPIYSAMSNFNKVLSDQLGKSYDQYINIDALNPDQLNINMFTPDELLNNGASYVTAYGYDYYGNKIKSATFEDFATKSSINKYNDTVYDRLIGAFKPIYMAGYIQDKFDYKDMKFNVGLRVDRYDANQKVLADRYILKPAYTKGEMSSQSDYTNVTNLNKADGVPSDAVVYLADNSVANNSEVVGYREGNTWYDVDGNIVQDPKVILDKSNGNASPALIKSDAFYDTKYNYSNNAFKDYKPQINLMPRIAFSFPISDVANFFAHYDVLTQRPSYAYNRMDPSSYYFFQQYITTNGTFNNPDLKAEKTIDYEIGFNQVLNERKSAALKISAFYRELRNQVATQRLNGAYPQSYITYSNLDFGTVKGLSLEYDMRRTGGFSMTANYTLQFAEGSGSNADGGYNLANTNQPNLRVTLPLDYDQRHTFTTTVDYRFGEGKDYKGPQFTKKRGDSEKTMQILKNVGANMVFRLGSGTPYTRTQSPLSDELIGVQQNTVIVGSLNGSYKPWQFRADLRIDKTIDLTFGKNKPEEKRKQASLTIYLQSLNVFNNKNIIAVHSYTGSPSDDGFLNAASTGQQYINTSILPLGTAFYNGFVDQYNAKLNSGAYYNRPRVTRIGVQFNF